jgi:centromeric protein E
LSYIETVVAIRMRPLNDKETIADTANSNVANRVWRTLPQYNSITQTTNTGKPLPERVTGRTFFTFDKTFGEDTTTKEVYDGVAKNIVESVVTGLNGTIFAYGQTSSGKTYTMQGAGSIEDGAKENGGGVVHMASNDIFHHIQNTPDRIFSVRVSFIEIYNEEVRDLLAENSVLQIREDATRGVFVNAHEEPVTDMYSLLEILFEGERHRAISATGMNERSSRSHTIFRITVESKLKETRDGIENSSSQANNAEDNDVDGAVRISTLNLVDLAGSESVRHTGNTGDRQKEGGKINQRYVSRLIKMISPV